MSISLSAGMRSAVYSMGDIQSQIDTSNKRLATGKKVNSALDNARSYFAAQAYRNDADKLNTLLDGMGQARLAVDKASKAIDGAVKLLQSADSLARAAQQSSSDPDRTAYQTQVAELLNQAAKLFSDSGFNGKQMLVNDTQVSATYGRTVTTATGAAGTLFVGGTPAPTAAQQAVYTGGLMDVQTNNATTGFTSITFKPVDVRFGETAANGGLALAISATGAETGFTAALGANPFNAGTGTNSWTSANGGTLARFRTNVAAAIKTLETQSSKIATQVSTLDIRTQFTKDTVRINNQAADDLTVADMNEEGANLSALQTKQQLAVQALSLASRSDQAIMRLF